jgi:hypothetical protein
MPIRKYYLGFLSAGLTVCFSFCVQFVFSQVQTITDKKDILIGGQIKLTVKAAYPLNSGPLSKNIIPDSIPHFEIVETGKIDTIDLGGNIPAIEQSFIITSFDSGRWMFPSLPVEFSGTIGQPSEKLMTDSFFVNVSYSPPDSTNELRDIKPIMTVTIADYFWYYIIGGAVLLLLIIFLLYRYFKKKKQEVPATPVSSLSPFNEAMEELKKLSQFNLQDAASIKTYHIRLAEIFKNYLGRKQSKNLLNKTTGDLLISMRGIDLPAENISDLATALRCTDAVKFAKYLPLSDQSEDTLQKIKETINLTERKTQNTKP